MGTPWGFSRHHFLPPAWGGGRGGRRVPAARLTYQKRPSASASLPNPCGGTSLSREQRPKGEAWFCSCETAWLTQASRFTHPSALLTLKLPTWCLWLSAQVTQRGLERSDFKNQQLIQNRSNIDGCVLCPVRSQAQCQAL